MRASSFIYRVCQMKYVNFLWAVSMTAHNYFMEINLMAVPLHSDMPHTKAAYYVL